MLQRDPEGGVTSCAWPRPQGAKHILLMGPGCPADAGRDHEDLVRDLAIKAGSRVLGENADLHYLPNGFEKFYDAKKVSLKTQLSSDLLLIRELELGSTFLPVAGFEKKI